MGKKSDMLRFDNITVFIKHPVSSVVIADALDVEPFEILGELIPLEIFLSPEEPFSDKELRRLGESIGVDFRIDEEGGSSTGAGVPVAPISPLSGAYSEEPRSGKGEQTCPTPKIASE